MVVLVAVVGGRVVVVVLVVFVGGTPEGLDGLVGGGVVPVVFVGGTPEGLDGVEGFPLKSAENATPLPATSATAAVTRPARTVRRG